MVEKKSGKGEEKGEPEKKKRQRKKDLHNIEPAEEPVKGPTGEDIYRV